MRLAGLICCLYLLLYTYTGYRLLGIVQFLHLMQAWLMLLEPSNFNHFEVLQEEMSQPHPLFFWLALCHLNLEGHPLCEKAGFTYFAHYSCQIP